MAAMRQVSEGVLTPPAGACGWGGGGGGGGGGGHAAPPEVSETAVRGRRRGRPQTAGTGMSNRARTPEVREAELAMAAAAGVRGLQLDALAEHAARELGVARTRFAPGPTEPTPYWEAPLEHWSRRPRRASSSDAGVCEPVLGGALDAFWNERFAVTAAEPLDAHRPLPPGNRPRYGPARAWLSSGTCRASCTSDASGWLRWRNRLPCSDERIRAPTTWGYALS